MKKKTLCVFLLAFVITIFSATVVCAEYHHVDGCLVCHDMHEESSNLAMIWEVIETPNSGNRNVKFTSYTGANSYADGDETYDGVCEVCHTDTNHHRNDGDNPDPDPHYAGTDCIDCHAHKNEFSHGGGVGVGCEACHGHDAGYEYQPGEFSAGAGTVKSHSTHTEDDSDDLKGPDIACDACHDTANYPFFESGTGNAPYDLSETDVCDACHSPGGVYNGVNSVSGSVGAKDNWINGVYSGDALATGKEKWCAGCHDNEPAFSSSNLIQIIMDDDEATYVGTWPLISSTSCAYDGDFRYNDAGTGSETATWIPDIPESGNYDVYVRWKDHSNRASNAPYTVFYDGGSDTVYKDCRVNGCQWNLLGTYPFAAGTSGYIQLTDNADGYLNADAIMITQSGTLPGIYAPNVIGDNAAYGFYATGHGAHEWVECLSCHNARTEHIDHEHRTYASASNNYQEGYRLAKPLVIPRPNRDDLYGIWMILHFVTIAIIPTRFWE